MVHFTPTPGCWLNVVEISFSIITRQAIRRGSFASVKGVIAAIGRFIDCWNDRCRPFGWTKTTADELLDGPRPPTSYSISAARSKNFVSGRGVRCRRSPRFPRLFSSTSPLATSP
jgi:hypothetical protein